jgi:Zn-finger nucleic acid-binding protein/RNA polymerase subunit RPABC4/transcription elongation factor Spt4
MTDAKSLHCPNCGAAADPHAARCPYCRARLATVSCPRCFALMFDGAAFCPTCGARSARADPQPSSTACPACHGAMARVIIGDLALLECASCDGVWVEAVEFERICADREAQGAVLHRWNTHTPEAPGTRVHYRPCIRCGKLMNRVNFGRMSGTVVDVCRGHGTFLDAGELHAIVTFIRDGGLDRARQREKDDLEEERHRLGMLKAQIESASRVSSDWEHRSVSLLDIRRLLKDE